MPAKRRPLGKKVLPRESRRAPVSRFLSADEKRQLILAHVQARRPIDAKQRASVWAGVIICTLLIVGVWAYTVGGNIRRSLASPVDPNVRQAFDASKQFAQDSSDQWQDISQRLRTMSEQRATIDGILEQFSTSSLRAVSSTRRDMFKPNSASETSTLHSLPVSN